MMTPLTSLGPAIAPSGNLRRHFSRPSPSMPRDPMTPVLPALEVLRTLDRAPTRRPVPRRCPHGPRHRHMAPLHPRAGRAPSAAGIMSCAPCGTCAVPSARGMSGSRTVVATPIRIPISFPRRSGHAGARKSSAKRGPPVRGARVAAREAELDSTMAHVERLLARKDSHVRIEDNQIVLSPLEADPGPPVPRP